MKKTKAMSASCILILILLIFSISLEVHAREDMKQIDGSFLTNESESIGYATPITRGDDLVAGYSKCVKLTNGNLYVGGTTLAAHPVERIGIAVMIERAREDEDEWITYDSWIVFEENEEWLSSAKELEVEGGYYYRVKCVHSAGNDMSSSFTDGLYFE